MFFGEFHTILCSSILTFVQLTLVTSSLICTIRPKKYTSRKPRTVRISSSSSRSSSKVDQDLRKDTTKKCLKVKDVYSFSSSESSDSTQLKKNEVISVECAQYADNIRIYNKKHACYYCGVLSSKIARHYSSKHKDERDVKVADEFPIGSKERKRHLEKLRLLGNYHHNMSVLETGEGDLIVVRRPSPGEACTADDFLPCQHCLGFIRRHDLWKHVASCQFKPPDKPAVKYAKVQMHSKIMIMPTITKEDNSVLNVVIASMKNDEFSLIIRNDSLIKRFGSVLVDKLGAKNGAHVSQKMREIARLLKQLRETNKTPDAELSDFIKPGKFDTVVQAVKILCNFQEKDGCQDVKIPSLALKLGHSLKKCLNVIRGQALRDKNRDLQEDADNFEKLLESEWSYRISHHSLTTLGKRKYNKVDVLPLAEDLEKLRKHVQLTINESAKALEHHPDPDNWSALAQSILTRLIMFNKRRGGEASKLLLESYVKRPDWTKANSQEIMQSLNRFERELSKRLDMVEIEGKRGRKVPVILTQVMKKGIDLLIKTRKEVGIADANPYVFARVNRESLGHIRGWDSLRHFTQTCEPPLVNPDVITGTKLRKYIATISQVLSLKENEVDWLARHLGHDIRVHRDYYRLHESTIEIAKVSKLLIAVDNGQTSKWAGKSLEEISIDDISEPDISDDATVGESSAASVSYCEKSLQKEDNCQKPEYVRPSQTSEDEEQLEPAKTTSKKSIKPKEWTQDEKKAVFKYLGHCIRTERVPGKGECETCKTSSKGALDAREWKGIKYFVKNQITKRKRQPRKNK